MATLSLLLAFLCAAGCSATTTIATTTTTTTVKPVTTAGANSAAATTSGATAARANSAAATTAAAATAAAAAATTTTAAAAATTAAATTTTAAAATAAAATNAVKTNAPIPNSAAGTVPPTNTPPGAATPTVLLTTKQIVPVTSSPQRALPTTTKTGTTEHVTITSQPGVGATRNVIATVKGPTVSTKDAVGLHTEHSTVATASQSNNTAIKTTASSTVTKEKQRSTVTDAANSTGINIPVSKSTVSPVTTSSTTASLISDPATSSLPMRTSAVILSRTTSLTLPVKPSSEPGVKHTYKDNIEVQCQKNFNGSLVKLNMKVSRICTNNFATQMNEVDEDDNKNAFLYLCKALKSGYQPNKDTCKIGLGYGDSPDQLAIVEAFVESRLDPGDLYLQLKNIKKEDNSLLFSYDKVKFEEEDLVSIPLISAIVCLAVALLIIAAIYGCWHQRQTRKREQRLTEELQTMENGYHDNPTLEVMETSPEMQEKKGGPNGELGDSWIVPLDNLTREDLDEEDTHL